jgi:hypothetical protein
MTRKTILLVFAICTVGCNPIEYDWSREGPVTERMVVIQTDLADPPVQFAMQEILTALKDKRYAAGILASSEKGSYHGNSRITIRILPDAVKPEGYELKISAGSAGNPQFEVLGSDAIGAMYGGLHIAEAIRNEKTLADIQPVRREPYFLQRGLSMNLALDGRRIGLADKGDAALKNYAQMWDLSFWTEFLDTMARYRYNTLLLRHPDPFPFMTCLKDYPDKALADVYIPNPAPDNLKIIKKMTIEEKVDLWRKVLRYARQRGIRTIMAVCAPAPEDLPYRQAAVGDFLLTYPDLAALITEGENPDPLRWVRLYVSDSPSLTAADPQTLWILNHDDILIHRWGDPDFVRSFLGALPVGQTAGYLIGSQEYVWGREFTDLEYSQPRLLEIVKHRYSFMLWGRLGYDPTLDRAFFEKVLKDQFPTADSALLYEAWQSASRIIPLVNRFHWKADVGAWVPEGCMGEGGQLLTVQDFIDPAYSPMPGSGLMSIADTVSAIVGGTAAAGAAPLQTAGQLERWSDEAIEKAERIKLNSVLSGPLGQTLADIEAMAWLGKYYAAVIRGAFDYALYKSTANANLRASAVEHLKEASRRWRNYAQKDSVRYTPQTLARTGKLDWWVLWEQTRRQILWIEKE